MTAHTAGPWLVSKNSDGMMIGPKVVASGGLVAAVSYDGAPGGFGAEADSNARLIAAAPELLAAFRQIVIECAESPNSDANRLIVILDLARAAIAKAKGAQK